MFRKSRGNEPFLSNENHRIDFFYDVSIIGDSARFEDKKTGSSYAIYRCKPHIEKLFGGNVVIAESRSDHQLCWGLATLELNSEPTYMDYITIISGLPRSGTSLMMQLLDAGGLPILTDHLRSADASNPRGYYEFEKVKKLPKGNIEWLGEAKGKAVKVVSALLEYLPTQYSYKVIFMRRHIEEVLASQREMLLQLGDLQKVSDEQLELIYANHLAKVEAWLSQQPNIAVLYVSYNEILDDPHLNLVQINHFLGGGLNIPRMHSVVDAALHRQRKTR